MNKELSESILGELAEMHPTIQTEIQEMNPAHPTRWYQIWLWNDATKQTPICIQTEYDWERFKLYRSLFVI
jgi:hypothetical protein